jgi:hypothetical protein
MGFSFVGSVISILMLLPSIVFFTAFPPNNMPEGLREAPAVFTVLEKIGQAGCFGILILSKNRFRLDKINIWAMLMLICIVIYYGLWFRYIRADQEFSSLWISFLFIPIPLAVIPVCAFGFGSLWGRSLWLGAATVILAIGHITVTWLSYMQIR